jgi:hypothetical protein
MLLLELFEPTPGGYSTDKEDNTVLKLSDLRTTRLDLAQLNKLRKMNDVRNIEQQEKIKTISKQYKPPAAEAAPGF